MITNGTSRRLQSHNELYANVFPEAGPLILPEDTGPDECIMMAQRPQSPRRRDATAKDSDFMIFPATLINQRFPRRSAAVVRGRSQRDRVSSITMKSVARVG